MFSLASLNYGRQPKQTTGDWLKAGGALLPGASQISRSIKNNVYATWTLWTVARVHNPFASTAATAAAETKRQMFV